MYHASLWANDRGFDGLAGYSPTFTPYDRCPSYTAHSRPVFGNWDLPHHVPRNPNWYQAPRPAYESGWGYRDNRGHGFRPHPNIYANTRDYLNTQVNNLLPEQWLYGDVHLPSRSPYSTYPEHDSVEGCFRPAVHNSTERARPNASAATPTLSYLADSESASPVQLESVSTPFTETAPEEDCNQEQANVARGSFIDNRHGNPRIPTAMNPSLSRQTGLQKCIQELKRERLHLRRERRSFHQLNSQLRSIMSSLRPAVNRQRGDGCRCRTDRNKGMNAHHGRRERTQSGQQSDYRANSHEENASMDESPATRRVGGEENPALGRYNAAWDALRTADEGALLDAGRRLEIPWPTKDLQYAGLGHDSFYDEHHNHINHNLPEEIMHNSFQLQKWRAFCFFVEAFGFRAYYAFEPVIESPSLGSCHGRRRKRHLEEDQMRLVFKIDLTGNTCSMSRCRRRLQALKAQMQQEKLRWHPDRWRLSMRWAVGMLADEKEKEESAKAVWGAIVEISQACDACLRE